MFKRKLSAFYAVTLMFVFVLTSVCLADETTPNDGSASEKDPNYIVWLDSGIPYFVPAVTLGVHGVFFSDDLDVNVVLGKLGFNIDTSYTLPGAGNFNFQEFHALAGLTIPLFHENGKIAGFVVQAGAGTSQESFTAYKSGDALHASFVAGAKLYAVIPGANGELSYYNLVGSEAGVAALNAQIRLATFNVYKNDQNRGSGLMLELKTIHEINYTQETDLNLESTTVFFDFTGRIGGPNDILHFKLGPSFSLINSTPDIGIRFAVEMRPTNGLEYRN